eukprot:s72_g21.t1
MLMRVFGYRDFEGRETDARCTVGTTDTFFVAVSLQTIKIQNSPSRERVETRSEQWCIVVRGSIALKAWILTQHAWCAKLQQEAYLQYESEHI